MTTPPRKRSGLFTRRPDDEEVGPLPEVADRTPWRDLPPADDSASIWSDLASMLDLKFGRGPVGLKAGRVWHRMRLRAQEETTAQLRGAYPFMADWDQDATGVFVGRDRFTQATFRYDQFAMYRRKLLSNPNILLVGVIGSAKSSLIKTLCLRQLAFGVRFVVPADTKGEMVPLGKAVGAEVVQLGAGMSAAINPLHAPPCPDWMDTQRYRALMEQQRLLLLSALGTTASGRPLTAREETAIAAVLAAITRQSEGVAVDRMQTPTLPQFVDLLMSPTQELADSVPVPLSVFTEDCLDLALRFRAMIAGTLRGIFDGATTKIDWTRPGVVIDISRIRASDAGVALAMTCGQALVDQILTFSKHQWHRILDECWRQIRYPAIVRRISEGQKLTRGDEVTTGSSTTIVLHRISDLMGADPDVRDIALGLLADCSTRIVYNQATDQIEATRQALALTDVEASMLPHLEQGTGLWKMTLQRPNEGAVARSVLVDHVVPRDGMEWPLVQTDSRMVAATDAPYRQVVDPAGEMATELGDPTDEAA